MKNRKSISKATRFEIFKRDGFVCQYCGASPPSAVLEIDHIIAVSSGGDNHQENLITSCFDCNRGKSNRDLATSPQSIKEKTEQLKIKEEQLAEYKKLQRAIAARQTRDINKIERVFSEYFDGYCFSDRFKQDIKTSFLKHIGSIQLIENMHMACVKIQNKDRAIKYFCGICWNQIRDESGE